MATIGFTKESYNRSKMNERIENTYTQNGRIINPTEPDMVEWKELGDFLNFEQPTPYLVKSTEYDNSYKTPVLTAGQSLLLGYTNETDGIYEADKDNPCIIFDDFTTSFHWIDFPFKVKSSAMKMLKPKKNTIFRYVYYAMQQIQFVPQQHQRHWISKYSHFTIPIPSLSEQKRIVGILDTFADSIENLKQQIAQRRKQYEHYRDQLLDLEGKDGVETVMLDEICNIKGRIGFRGYTRDDQVEEGKGALSLSPGNIVNGKMDYSSSTFITWYKYEESPEIKIYNNDVIFCKTGSTVGKVAIVENLPYKATINPQLVVLKDITINFRYLAYYLATFPLQSKVKALAGVGSVPNISQSKLGSLEIPIPSSNEQQRIVSILDTFEASISNLEAQLEQRQKQYEYYRNQLLTFE